LIRKLFFSLLLLTLGQAGHAQTFMDITSLTSGGTGVGTFSGTLGAATVTGSILSSNYANSFTFNSTSNAGLSAWELSDIGATSPQFSYSTIYAVARNNVDTLGYTLFNNNPVGTTNTARMQLSFSRPVKDLVINVANLDNSTWDFTASGGVSSLTLLKGNGNGTDGLGINGKIIRDLANGDVGLAPSTTPTTSGTRSGYGSVMINGTYSSLTIDLTAVHSLGGDGGNFTLILVPEPTSIGLLLPGAVGLLLLRRRRKNES
jgi:hypothetical protein